LSNQATELANMVHKFKLSAGGGARSANNNGGRRALPSLSPAKPAVAAIPNRRAGGPPSSPTPAEEFPRLAGVNQDGGGRRGLPSLAPVVTVKSARAIKPEEIIPLDDDDLGEF